MVCHCRLQMKVLQVSERVGVIAAVVSSSLGGMAAATTRYVIGVVDPVTLAAFRFGIGALLLLPVAFALRSAWPKGRDWIGVAALGVLFFGLFFVLYNVSLAYTTAARASLALSALPLLTMVVAAVLGIERLTARKTLGVLVAIGGVAFALAAGLSVAPQGAWRGDLVMAGAALCMALYTIWSRPFIARSSPLTFVAAGMSAGALCNVLLAWERGGFAAVDKLDLSQWLAIFYMGIFAAAVNFFLWVYALKRTTPTRVAATITVTPVTSSLLASVLVHEPIGLNLVLGVAAVGAGIWIASTEARTAVPIPAGRE